MKNGKTHLAFTEEEEKRGREALKSFGLPESAEFVCIFSRDEAYLQSTMPEFNSSHLDFRDSDIRNFLPAAAEMTRRGYYVFRMGAAVKNPLPELNNPMIIDFPFTNKRTDFLDIYLWGRCKFVVGTAGGATEIAVNLRRPVASVNWIPLSMIVLYDIQGLFIPKKKFIKRLNRYATFLEQIFFESSSVNTGWRTTSEYHGAGLEVEENSSQEILDLAIEMDDRLRGIHITSQDDEKLQAQFWSLFPTKDPMRVQRVGAKFLKDNRNMLGSV
jgi:putative glycosyltransferase (TIGR04372 family)